MQSIVSCVELLDIKFLSLFSELWFLREYLFNYCYSHITYTVAFWVEVGSCCFGYILCGNISFMLTKSLFQHSLCFSDILLGALIAPQQIYYIFAWTVYSWVDVHYYYEMYNRGALVQLITKWTISYYLVVITSCLTIGILCQLLLSHDILCYFMLSCSSPALLCSFVEIPIFGSIKMALP